MNTKSIAVLLLIGKTLVLQTLFCQNICQSNRFTDSTFFTKEKIKKETNIPYGVAANWHGAIDTLKFNICYPKKDIDNLKQRPFVMLLHGGGFQKEEDLTSKKCFNTLCKTLAKMGYVAATIDYRIGWKENKNKNSNQTSLMYATYRAYQDARAALRYFVHNASLYGIDTNNMFIGGRSAGGNVALATAFSSQRNIDSIISLVIPDNCSKTLGSVDTSTNGFTDKFKIRGVINMWGPIADTSFISKAEAMATPIIMFHGDDDNLIPYKKATIGEYPYARYGSYCIARRYKNLGACYQLNTKHWGGHGEDFSDVFLADKISQFLKNVMCNTCKSEEFETTIPWKVKVVKVAFSKVGLYYFIGFVAVFILYIFISFRKEKKTS